MKRLIWLPIAGFLLIAGAAVAAAAPSIVDSAKGLLGAADQKVSAGTITVNADSDLVHPGQDLLNEVLADLVSQDVITQAQSDAISEALQARVDERRADIEAQREEMRQTMEQVQGFLEDGVITQEEISQLPEDNPLRQAFDGIAQDGQITLDQLKDLAPGWGFGFMRGGPGGPGMHGHGPGFWFQVPDTTDSSSDSNTGASSNS